MDNVTPIDALRALTGAEKPAGPRARIITSHQHKGGVGKTRVAMELACVLSGGTMAGAAWNVPIIDLDATSGGNATRQFGIHYSPDPAKRPESTLLRSLRQGGGTPPRLSRTDLKDWRQPFVPGHPDIVENQIPREDLRDGILGWAHVWHQEMGSPYVIVDTVPGRNPLTDGALQASDLIVVPTILAKESLNALEDLLEELMENDYDVLIVPNMIRSQPKEMQVNRLARICERFPGVAMSPFIRSMAAVESRATALPITHHRTIGAEWGEIKGQYIDMARAAQQTIISRHAARAAA